ncbi:hypothetical protein [Okibacterium fritillariae]|uniref:CAAX protease self-immunity n=1 Tax=Okibacterium fritillariae TaxID=123320 RepID=A0A1T5IB79_9MICO|nr:hypothetical protein [Okibacterium fritillariae]SKC36424.1 hypothetical protein SAMN06309945_0191 [Okibacterium fritillariae]
MTTKPHSAWDDLASALIVFAVFAWEFVVLLLIDPFLFRDENDPAAPIWHHAITAAGWALGAALLSRSAARVGVFTDRTNAAPTGSVTTRTLVAVAAASAAVLIRAAAFGEFKIGAEIADIISDSGNLAPLGITALLAYYVAEAALIVLVILFGQRAGEKQFGRRAAPWGGIVLAGTWGIMHIFLQGPAGGAYAIVAAVLYGLIVTYGPRRVTAAGTIAAAAFII